MNFNELANSEIDLITSEAEKNVAQSKLDLLQQRIKEKVNILNKEPVGGLAGLTGDAFKKQLSAFAQMDQNTLSPEDLQYALGYATTNPIQKDEEGRRFKLQEDSQGNFIKDANGQNIREYVSDELTPGRNVYIDNTVDNNMKIGLAAEDKGFIGRYTPDWKQYVPFMKGYGWAPGEKGVTPKDGALMDTTLDYNLATNLEKVIHSNRGQIKNRVIGEGPITDNAIDDFGSGKTEYTTPNAPLWNINYKDDGTALKEGTPLPKPAYKKGSLEEFLYKHSSPEEDDRSILERVTNFPKAVAQGLIKTGIDKENRFGEDIDMAQGAIAKFGADAYNMIEKVVGKENIDKYNTWASGIEKALGGDGDVGMLIGKNGEIKGTPLNIKDFRNIETSMKEFGVEKETIDEHNAAMAQGQKDWTEAKTVWDKIKAMGVAASQLDRILAGSAGEIAALGIPGGPAIVAATRTSNFAEEYEKNNGKPMDNAKLAETFMTQLAVLVPEKLLIKTGVVDTLGRMVGKIPGGAAKRIGIATLGETGQEYGEAVTEKWATQKEGDKTLGEIAVAPEQTYAAAVGGVMGAGTKGIGEIAAATTDIPSALLNAGKKGIELATETPLQKDLRQLREYSAPLQNEAVVAATTGDYQTVADRVEKVHGKLADKLDPSAAKGRTYATILDQAMNKALMDGDSVALDNVYKTMKELHNDKNVEFDIRDVVHKDASQMAQEFVRVINSGTKDTEDVAAKFRGEVGKEADKQASIIETVQKLREIAEIKAAKMKSVMGTDLEDSVTKEIDELNATIDGYLANPTLEKTNQQIAKLGYLILDPEKGIVSDPSRPGLAVYEEALTEQLLNPKTNKSLLAKELKGTAGASTKGGSIVRLQGLTEFAKSRADKLMPRKERSAVQTDKIMDNMLIENAQMSRVIDNVLATASGLTGKGLDADTKQSYINELNTAKGYVETANKQLNDRKAILSTVTKPEGLAGAPAFHIDAKTGKESIQVMNKVDDKWTYTKIADVVDGKVVMLDSYPAPVFESDIETGVKSEEVNTQLKPKFDEFAEVDSIISEFDELIKIPTQSDGAWDHDTIATNADKLSKLIDAKVKYTYTKDGSVLESTGTIIGKGNKKGTVKLAVGSKGTEINVNPYNLKSIKLYNQPTIKQEPLVEVDNSIHEGNTQKALVNWVNSRLNEGQTVDVLINDTIPNSVFPDNVKQKLVDYLNTSKSANEQSEDINDSATEVVQSNSPQKLMGTASINTSIKDNDYWQEKYAGRSNKAMNQKETVEESKEAPKSKTDEPLKVIRDKINIMRETLKEATNSVDDMNLKAAIKNYYKKELADIDSKRSLLQRAIEKLENDIKTENVSVNKLMNVMRKLALEILAQIDQMMIKLSSYKVENKELKKLKNTMVNELNGLITAIDAIESDYGQKTTTEKTAVGTITKYEDSVYGPMAELGDKRKSAKPYPTKEDKTILVTPVTAMLTAMKELGIEKANELIEEGSLGGTVLANNIKNFTLISPIVKILKQTEDSIFGKMDKEMFSDPEKLIDKLPKSFKEIFASIDKSKDELVKNISTMDKFIKGIDVSDILVSVGNKLSAKTIDSSGYISKFITTADGVEQEVPVEMLGLLGNFRKVENSDNLVTYKTGEDLVNVLEVDERVKTIIKFYAAKLIADTQSMVGKIGMYDESEMSKYFSIYDAEELIEMKEAASQGYVTAASVRSDIGDEVYSALGFKFTKETPEKTKQTFIDSLGALVQAAAVDSGLITAELKTFGSKNQTMIRVNLEEVNTVLGTAKNGTSELAKAINKLQYMTESRSRPLLSKTKPKPKANGTRLIMNTKVPVSDSDNEWMNNEEKKAYTVDTETLEKYLEMSDEDFLKSRGNIDPETLPVSKRLAQQGKNDKVIREWDLLKTAYYAMGSDEFYLNWGQTVSERFTIQNDIQYQESKLHREFVHEVGMEADVDWNNVEQRIVLEGSVLQASDMGPDKLSLETAREDFEKLVKVTDSGIEITPKEGDEVQEAIKEAYETLRDTGKINVEASAIVFAESEGHHGLSAIEVLVKWNKAIVNKVKSFKTKMQLESDAITSGMILTLLQIGTSKAIELLEKGGVYTKQQLEERTEYVQYWLGSKDKKITFSPGALIEAGKKHAAAIEDKAKGVATKEQLDMLEDQEQDITSNKVFKDLYSTIGVAMLEDVKKYKEKIEKEIDLNRVVINNSSVIARSHIPGTEEYKSWTSQLHQISKAMAAENYDPTKSALPKRYEELKNKIDTFIENLPKEVEVALVGETERVKKELYEYKGEYYNKLSDEIRLLAIFDQLGELNLKNIRSIAKSPVMVYVYGASMNSIKTKLGFSLGVDTLTKAISTVSRLYKKAYDNVANYEQELMDKGFTEVEIIKASAKLGEMYGLTDKEIEELNKNNSFIDLFVPNKDYVTATGAKVDVSAMPKWKQILHIDINAKLIKQFKDLIDKSFGGAIEGSFDKEFGFINENRDAMKALEVLQFEMYQIKLTEKIEAKLLDKKKTRGKADEISEEDLRKINAELVKEGFGHTIVWESEGETKYQPMTKSKKVASDNSTIARVGNTKATVSVKEQRPTVNTGAMATIPIHAIDGNLLMRTLNSSIRKTGGKNIYDAIATMLNAEMIKNNGTEYNTNVIEVGFERSIIADQLKLVNAILIKDPTMLEKVANNIGLRPKGKNNADYTKEVNRLGLGIGRIIEVLEIVESNNRERVDNSGQEWYSAHMYIMGQEVTKVEASNTPRAKELPEYAELKQLLIDVKEADKVLTKKEFAEKKIVLHDKTDLVLYLDDIVNRTSTVKSKANLAQVSKSNEMAKDGTPKLKVDDNLVDILSKKDVVQIIGTSTARNAIANKEINGSQKWYYDELINGILKSNAGIVATGMDEQLENSGRTLVDGVWVKETKMEIVQNEVKEYTVKPNRRPDMLKAPFKASKSTKYIGYGKEGSSTALYAKQLAEQGMPVNTGQYTKDDVVFVSINGTPERQDYINTLKHVISALNNDALVLTDSEEYLAKSTYNKGEQQLAKNLLARGYNRVTSKGNKEVAIWSKIKSKPRALDEVSAEAKVETGTLSAEQITELKEIFMNDKGELKAGIAKLVKELKLDMKDC